MENVPILGISLGTRQCGIVILRNGTLVDWKVKNFAGIWSENKRLRIVGTIEKYIVRNGIKQICCKMPIHLRTMRIDSLLEAIKEVAIRRDVKLCITTILELKANEMACIGNKDEYAELLSRVYPELSPILNRHRKVRTEYYLRIFEAVGAAQQCLKHRGVNV